VDPQFVKQLNESPSNRYSFVCSALVNICNCQTHNDRSGLLQHNFCYYTIRYDKSVMSIEKLSVVGLIAHT